MIRAMKVWLPRGAVLPFPHPQRLEYKLSQMSSLTHSLSLTKWSSPGHTCSYGFQAKIPLTFCSQLKDLVTETATKQMARSSKIKTWLPYTCRLSAPIATTEFLARENQQPLVLNHPLQAWYASVCGWTQTELTLSFTFIKLSLQVRSYS
jgi:hypothetical protein